MKVYLSSTLNDLGPETQAVKDALGGECTVVESYTADERSLRESCVADVAGCDLYIGIVGLRYGFIPPGQKCSITELEYLEAREGKVPVPTLVFVKDEDEIKPRFHDAVTNENPRERIEAFRRKLTSGTDEAARFAIFKSPEDLKAHVLKAYLRYSKRQEGPRPKPIEGRPYPGLRAFLPTEADRFFGRDAEVDSLLERVLARGDRFLALIGASGSGKSSLVYAGLIPKLSTGASVGGVRWLALSFSPRQLGDDPFLPLGAALVAKFPDLGWRPADLAQRLRADPADIGAVTREALPAASTGSAGGAGSESTQLLLFVDQFEELFAAKVDAGDRAAFFALLVAAVASPLLRVVIAMRSDFYGRWPQDEASVALLRAGHFPVAVPGAAALEKMIVGPAHAAGLTFEPPGLAQRILDDIGTAPGALALAEFALAQLYDKRRGLALTAAAYDAIGGVAGAIEGQAEKAVKSTEDGLRRAGGALDEEAWSHLFMAIASVEDKGQEQAVVRRRCTAAELPGAALALAQHQVDQRLLVSSGAGGDEAAAFEVGHEAVFSHWRRFKDWHKRYAEHLAVHRQAERAAAEWAKAGRSPILRWGWERQKPALQALRQLEHLALPAHDPDYTDATLALWRVLEARLPNAALKAFLHPEPLALLDELKSDATTHQRREEIGLRLAQMGDPRRGIALDEAGLPSFEWIDIPAGEVTLEIADQQYREGAAAFKVKPFKLARYPVTWAQYRAFLDADDGYRNPQWWQGRPREDQPGQLQWAFANHPAINVSWFDAMACCAWLRAKLGMDDIRLPTEWEWQWAAAGPTKQKYPWPGEWNGVRANSSEAGIGRTTGVGMYPQGGSPFGVDDMAGNVWEWCLNTHDDPASVSLAGSASRVLRGGSWYLVVGSSRAASRQQAGPDYRLGYIGLRVCRGSPIE